VDGSCNGEEAAGTTLGRELRKCSTYAWMIHAIQKKLQQCSTYTWKVHAIEKKLQQCSTYTEGAAVHVMSSLFHQFFHLPGNFLPAEAGLHAPCVL
jgi:hypothetical protein